MSAEPILVVEDLAIAFGGIRAVDGVSFSVRPHGITSLIGGNGAGKTTAFNLISGHLKPDRGSISFRGKRIDGMRPHQIARLGMVRGFQELRLFNRLTARDNVQVAIRDQRGEHVLAALFGGRAIAEEKRRCGEQADAILDSLSISAHRDSLAENLSYGQQKLLSLGRLLANGGDLLLLDEPTSGINPHLVAEFCQRIRGLIDDGKTIFLIEHNVEVVMALSDWVIVMHQGQVIAEGPPDAVRRDHAVMHAYLGID